MQSHELFQEVFEKKKPKEIAADLGLSSSMIYKWGEPNTAGSGIGNLLIDGSEQFRMDLVLFGIVVVGATGWALNALARRVERVVLSRLHIAAQ